MPITQKYILLLLLSITLTIKDHEIGERSVLLPIDYGATHRVQHLIEAYGGCYTWTTNEPSVLKIQTLKGDPHCESRVLIEVQKEGPFSGPLTISATDKDTGQVIKAVVRLSKLHRIEILTKFRIMNLYQVQQFYLIGYDQLGNSFSSLEGLKFQWTLEQTGRIGEKISIKESNIFQQTNYRRSLEEIGYETDMLVVRALNIGEIQLNVRLNQPNYEHIHSSIRLSIQERFEIAPASPIYMIAGSKLKFNLLNVKGQKIKLPAQHYQYSLSEGFKASDELLVTSPNFQTEGKLVVKDTRTHPAYTNQIKIYNLLADNIEVTSKSYVIVGQEEPFKISLYNNRRLLKGSTSVKLDSDFYLNVANSSFVASSKGSGVIQASYEGLTHEKRIIANHRIKAVLIDNKIVLPPGQSFQLRILGGSGSYDFSLLDSQDVAFINHNGVINSKNPGKAKVVVVDNNDHDNKIQIDLVVDRVKAVRSFDEKLESGIGEEVTMLAIAQPENQRQYTQCDDLPISILENDLIQSYSKHENTMDTILKIHDNARKNPQLTNILDIFRQGRDFSLNDYRDYVVHDQIPLPQLQKILFLQDNFGICKALKAKPLVAREGQAHFQIRGEKDYVSTPFKVKIYDELSYKDQISTRIILSPGSTFVWKSDQIGEESSVYYLNDIKIKAGDSIILSCSHAGQIKEYTIKSIHQVSQRLPRPFSRSVKLTVQCLQPSALKFKVNNNIIQNGQLSVVNDEPFVSQLRGFDHLGRQFYNISTLDLNWNLQSLKKSDVSPQDNIYKFQITNPKAHPHINVKTTGSKYYGMKFPEIQANLDILKSKGFHVMFKNKPISQHLTLVATPNHKQILRILQGSGNFQVRCQNPELIKCVLNSNSKTIEVTPLKKGNTIMQITDLQQYGRPSSLVYVNIVNPVRLKVSANATLVEEGSGFKVDYTVYGEGDLLIDEAQYEYLNIVPKHTCELEQLDPTTFRTIRRGQCSISASIPFYSISSENTVQVLVFPKFSINIPQVSQEERNGIKYYTGETRIPLGCESTIMFLGGPFGVGKLTYELNPTNVVTIEELNLRTFKLVGKKKGNVNLKFVLRDGEKDISIINILGIVKDIDNIQLAHNGNRQIHEKATVRLLPELLIDGKRVLSSKCPIKYEWKTDNQDVIDIRGWNFAEAEDNIGINVTGLRKGYAKVELTPIYAGKTFSKQQIIIQVLETPLVDLSTYIHHGKVHPTSLLIPPNSGYTLNSSYQIDIVSSCEKLLRVVGNDIQTFNDKGGSVVKLKMENRDHSVSYMSVQIQRIHSVFIQNPLSKLSLQMDTEVLIPFYVQDSFGRLFPNNLKGVNYEIRISDPRIVSAQISSDKQYIILRGFKSGICELYLSIEGQPDIYDIVPIQTMVLITPTSPVSVHVGGSIEFKALKGGFGQWASDNPFVLQIDKRTGKALALREGSTQISYSHGIEYKSRINVFKAVDVVLKESRQILTNYKGDEHSLQLKVYAEKGSGLVELNDLNRPMRSINNNLVVKCQSKHPLWYEVQCSIQSINDLEQVIYVYPKAVKVYPKDSQMPKELQFQVKIQSGATGQSILSKQIISPFYFQFRIPKSEHYISLNSREKSKTIEIQTNSKLGVYSQYSRLGWLQTEFIPERSVQLVKIDFKDETDGVKPSIKIVNHVTKQSDQVTVNYNPFSSSSSRGGLLEWLGIRWGWTSWIILLMIVIIFLLFACACLNKDYVFYAGKDD